MAIRPSSARQIEALVASLSSSNPVARDSAIARLIVIGPRAVERLAALTHSRVQPAVRAAALRALEAIGDARAVDAVLTAVSDADPTVALPAIAHAGRWLHGPNGAATVDRLTAAAVDRARPEAVRVAALRALCDLDRRTIAPLLKSLAADPVPAVRAAAAAARGRVRRPPPDPRDVLGTAAERGLPWDPERLQWAIAQGGDAAPLTVLLRIVERARERETGLPAAARATWSTVRAAAHVALANRASRLALYDLRESLETNDSVPVEFLTALTMIGDASCLPAMAGAHARSRDAWLRTRLVDVFRTVVKRERLTRRHAVLKKIQKRWPTTFDQLVG